MPSFDDWCERWIDEVRRTALSLLRREGSVTPVALLAGLRRSGGQVEAWNDTVALCGEELEQDVEYVRRQVRHQNALAVCMVFMADRPRARGQGVDSRLHLVVERAQDAWSWSWRLRRRGKRWVRDGKRLREDGSFLGGLRFVDRGFVHRYVRKRLKFAVGARVWRILDDVIANVWSGARALEPPTVDDLVEALRCLPQQGVVMGAARTRRIAELVMDAMVAQGFRVDAPEKRA